MKTFFAVGPKYKLALSLMMLVILLFCGILAERTFFNRVDEVSSSLYNDRLIPSTAVYHIYDHVAERRFLMEEFVEEGIFSTDEMQQKLVEHRNQTDSIITAFELTYLVQDESHRLNKLKVNLQQFSTEEDLLLMKNGNTDLKPLFYKYKDIRRELMGLSDIQVEVGAQLMSSAKSSTSKAGLVSNLQIAILIITCLIVQGLILASKAISSPFKQQHDLN